MLSKLEEYLQTAIEKNEFNEILIAMVTKIKESKEGYYLSWWLRVDMLDKYSTTKINYELSKAVKKGYLLGVSNTYGIKYYLP